MLKRVLLSLLMLLIPCLGSASTKLFESGFESTTAVGPSGFSYPPWSITGTDAETGYNWVDDIISLGRTAPNGFGIYGNEEQTNTIELTTDPADAGNNVLHYKALSTDGNSTRCQAAMLLNQPGDPPLMAEGYIKYRIRLAGFDQIPTNLAALDWMILIEMFEHLSTDTGCQISSLHFGIHYKDELPAYDYPYWYAAHRYTNSCNTGWVESWNVQNTDVPIVANSWYTIEMYFYKGDNSTGRLVMYITPEGGARTILFDVTNYTQNPTRSGYMDEWSMFKLYCDGNTTNTMATAGDAYEIWYDDFEYWDGMPPTMNQNPGSGLGGWVIH